MRRLNFKEPNSQPCALYSLHSSLFLQRFRGGRCSAQIKTSTVKINLPYPCLLFCLDQTIVKVIFDALLRLPTASFSSKHYATARIKATFIETKLHKMSFGFRVYRPTASTSESKHRVKYTALLSSLVVLPGHPFENFFFYA